MKISFKSNIASISTDISYTILGIFFTAFALKSFLVPNEFLDGGVTGVSLLIHEIYKVNLSVVIILTNIPFIIMGAIQINKKFALNTLFCVILLALCLQFFHFPVISTDKLIVSIFGGFFLGLGIGLAMRGGCALDGIEVLALYTLKRSSFTISEIILGLNVIIFLAAAIHFGLERALFSMLTYYIATKTIDYVIEGLEEYTGITIISSKSEEIKQSIVMKLGKGITVYKGERGFMKGSFDVNSDCDIVFTIITRLEVRRLKNMVHSIDPNAFVFTNTIKEATGGILKKRKDH